MGWGGVKNTYELVNVGAFNLLLIMKLHPFQYMGKIFCVEFQREVWNSAQTIFSIHWKRRMLFSIENLGPLRFTRFYECFWNILWATLSCICGPVFYFNNQSVQLFIISPLFWFYVANIYAGRSKWLVHFGGFMPFGFTNPIIPIMPWFISTGNILWLRNRYTQSCFIWAWHD